MHLPILVRLGLFMAAGLFTSCTFAYDFEISYHEHFQPVSLQNPEKLSFVAFGQQFDLELEPNTGITETASTALFRGRLTGTVGSWARLNQSGERLSGVIWDGNELWLIDSHDRLDPYLTQPDTTGLRNQRHLPAQRTQRRDRRRDCG